MIPVEQRQLWRPDDHPDGPQRGDCLRACVASLFELPYEAVPDFSGYSTGVAEWMRERFPGFGVVEQHVTPSRDQRGYLNDWRRWPHTLYRPGYWIASVYSHRIPDVDLYGCGCTERVPGGDPECQWCHGIPEERHMGIQWGLHAIVMKHGNCAWDPHPERDADHYEKSGDPFKWRFRSAMTFVVEDPAVLIREAEAARDAA